MEKRRKQVERQRSARCGGLQDSSRWCLECFGRCRARHRCKYRSRRRWRCRCGCRIHRQRIATFFSCRGSFHVGFFIASIILPASNRRCLFFTSYASGTRFNINECLFTSTPRQLLSLILLDILIVRLTRLLRLLADMTYAPQPDRLGNEDTGFESHARNVETGTEGIEPLLCDNSHEGEEGAEVVDG